MEIKLKPLRYFLAVAEERSFSKAAARLFVAQPSLSAQIKALEESVGFALFNRTSRQVELTRQGRLFQVEALALVNESRRLERAAQAIRSIDLRLGASFYSILIHERTRLIDHFMHAHPGIALQINNRNQFRLFPELVKGQIDLALAMGLETPAAERATPTPRHYAENVLPDGFERMTLCRRRVHLLVPSDDRLARAETIPVAALRGARIALFGRYHGSELVDAITTALDGAGVEFVEPPESNAVAVERYGAQFGIPAVSLGWFPAIHTPDGTPLVARAIDGFELHTALVLLRRPGPHFEAVETFWQTAMAFAPALAGEPSA